MKASIAVERRLLPRATASFEFAPLPEAGPGGQKEEGKKEEGPIIDAEVVDEKK